jgi:hypothetical protein
MCFNALFLSTQQWHLALDDRPCAQHVQSTCRMSLMAPRPSIKRSTFLLVGMGGWVDGERGENQRFYKDEVFKGESIGLALL